MHFLRSQTWEGHFEDLTYWNQFKCHHSFISNWLSINYYWNSEGKNLLFSISLTSILTHKRHVSSSASGFPYLLLFLWESMVYNNFHIVLDLDTMIPPSQKLSVTITVTKFLSPASLQPLFTILLANSSGFVSNENFLMSCFITVCSTYEQDYPVFVFFPLILFT